MAVLSRTVHALKGSIESKEKVTSKHILSNISDNTMLISEVNDLRKDVMRSCNLYLIISNRRYLLDSHFGSGEAPPFCQTGLLSE
jgi:hypothetical protein